MKMKMVLLTLCILLLVSCIPGDGKHNSAQRAGFLWGVWHGWIAPVSLIISFFNPSRSIYEVYNIGFAYDFGFYIAILGGFGGIRLFRKSRNRNGNED